MAPFEPPGAIVSGFKEKAEALVVQGDRLYIGTSTGNLHIYGIDESPNDGEEHATLVETKKALTRKAIEQLGFIKDINSLVVLSESQVTLYPLPSLTPATPLPKAKAAFSFASYSAVQHMLPDGQVQNSADKSFDKAKAIPTLFTWLGVGCRRKIVIYSWRDGEAQDVVEAVLPHSPRAMAFLDHSTISVAYSPTEYAVFSIERLTATDVALPSLATTSMAGMGAFAGLTGYMTLGLGTKPRSGVLRMSDTEALVAKDNQAFTIGVDGKLTRSDAFDWPAPPEDLAFVRPYIFSVLPSGSVPTSDTKESAGNIASPPYFIQTSVVQIRSSLSRLPVQTLPFPFSGALSSSSLHTVSPSSANSTIRLLTPSPSAKSPLFLITTPSDRTQAVAEGSTIWQFRMKPWSEQVDELVRDELYSDALALLETIDEALLLDKEQRKIRIRALNAVSQFRAGNFDDAINTFIELDFNPAKVVALYPDNVAGRLSVPQDKWISLYGGPVADPKVKDTSSSETGEDGPTKKRSSSPTGSITGKLKTGLGALLPSTAAAEDDTVSVHSVKQKSKPKNDSHRSVETLVRYLSDRRPKVGGALDALHINPSQLHQIAFLSQTSADDLFALPNAPLSSLTSEQLLRFAQIVDTALFKSYLVIRPGLLGPLCRVPNWCEVSEVEEELRAREKFAELIYLYNGKKMHDKALGLLRHLSEREDDPRDKLMPSVSYLQKLGPEYLQQVFESARWVFERDRDIAFEIFTSEDVELPRADVADYLEQTDPSICARYIVFLIEERGEVSSSFHDRLAELYLSMTLSARKQGNEKSWRNSYSKLLQFINSTHYYSVDRLYGLLSSEDLYEARAILLGRLGRHEHALELYVYRLQDYLKAEEYCKSIHQPGTPTTNIFLTLLRIYLRPTVQISTDLLQPALELIGRHSPRLDPVETLQLLPPLVTAQDVRTFLIEALRAPIFDTRVVREINKARNDQVARRLVLLQSKRVKVTDSRICPQCHKRIGNSVIAVHAPRGEVTHYQCREAFSNRMNDTRRR